MICSIFIVISCIEYEVFERIENDKLRVIGVRYEPFAEFSPGDTLTCKAYFAGDEVTSIYDFSGAYTVRWDDVEYHPDERNIRIIDTILWLPDSIQFRYCIPEDIFIKERSLYTTDSAKIRRVYELVKKDRLSNGTLFRSFSKDSLLTVMSDLKSIYTPCYLFFHARSKNGSELKVRSDFIIRYNSDYPDYMMVNKNPQIKWIAVFKVPDHFSNSFNPNNPAMANQFTTYYLYNERNPGLVCDTIEIDDGYTYFFGGNEEIDTYVDPSGDTLVDTTCDFVPYKINDTIITVKEYYNYIWFYQNIDKVSDNSNALMNLERENSWYSVVELKPPVLMDMKHFKVWLVIYDSAEDFGWAKGNAVKEVSGVFKYTESYIKSIKD